MPKFNYDTGSGDATAALEVFAGDLTQPLALIMLDSGGAFSASIPLPAGLPDPAAVLSLRLNTAGAATSADVLIDNFDFSAASVRLGDFDDKGAYNCQDIDALVAAVTSGLSLARFDLNQDGAVGLGDVDEWLRLAGQASLPSGNAYLAGDANLDGVVDGPDFIVWNNHKFTSTAAWCSGDCDADDLGDVWPAPVIGASDFLLAESSTNG